VFQHIDDEVAGDARARQVQEQVLLPGQEDAEGGQRRLRPEVVVQGLDLDPVVTAAGEQADLDRRLGVQA
jgi:hypothetical protein